MKRLKIKILYKQNIKNKNIDYKINKEDENQLNNKAINIKIGINMALILNYCKKIIY